jgi:hypothetical protein
MKHSAAQADEDHGTGHVEPDFADRMVESPARKGPGRKTRHAHKHKTNRTQSDGRAQAR